MTEDESRRLHEAAWPDMFADLQSAYAEVVNTRFELERRAAQIAETRDLYQQIVSTMSEAVFLTNLTGQVLLTNPAAAALLECEENMILGHPLATLCGTSDVPATPWQLMQRARGGRLEDLELVITSAKGARIPVNFFCTLMRDNQRKIMGVLAVAHDMRRIRGLIDDLIAARARFQELLEFAPEAIALADRAGRVTLINSQTEKLFGYRREELIGQNIEMLFPMRMRDQQRPDEVLDLDEPRSTLNQIAIGRHAEAYGLNHEGHEFPIEIIQRQIATEDGPLTLSLIRDITERKRIERERAEMLAREQEARRLAEEAGQVKDDFLAMVSHELRAPLTVILGWTQMLRAATDRPSAEHALDTIERNVKTQAHLISDLLDASRIATGKMRLEVRPVELMSLVESSVDALRPQVEAKKLRLQLVLEPWVGPFEGDPERLKQVIWNLLSNAIKFTPPGGLIEVRLEKLENKALFIVSDTGQGIEPEFLPQIFDRFRQADGSIQRAQRGLGLGLAIVRYIVEAHGGAIYAYSAGVGRGSDFMITLPLAKPSSEGQHWLDAAAPAKPTAETPGQPRAGKLHGLRALVVDDERDTREVISAMLNRYGAEVRAAASAFEALTMLRQWLPDVLISDIGMPVEDGYALINQVRALPKEEGGETPAVALTAFAGIQDRNRALSTGFQLHVAKPVEPAELARVIARLVGRDEREIK